MNKNKEMYKAPKIEVWGVSRKLNLLNTLSNPHQAEFGDLENKDEWV